ncbi:MAG: serine--tRNA ligase, partial [Slackia sp.]
MAEEVQAQRNKASKEIGALMGKGEKEAAEAAKEEVRQINEKLEKASAEREAIDAEMNDILVGSPNLPCDTTPVGKDETENPERRRWGAPRDFAAEGFEPKAHWDLGTDLD